MTQEEKAKAYDKALELARVAAFNGHQSLMEGIFPELAESEDERIREYLIRYIDNTMKSSELKSKLLAWLEKQGESSDQIHYWTEEEIEPIISDYLRGAEHYGGMIGRLRCLKPKSLEKQGEKSLTVDIESMIEAYEQRLINQGNGVRNSPIVNMCVAAFKHGVENTLDELHLKQGETSPILSNSSNIGKDEQKPAWSEEDKEMFDKIRSIVEKYAFSQSAVDVNGDLCEKEYIEADNWLKSLKNRYTWKPSDKQMKALDSVIDEYDGYPEFDSLVSLKNDLKKL